MTGMILGVTVVEPAAKSGDAYRRAVVSPRKLTLTMQTADQSTRERRLPDSS